MPGPPAYFGQADAAAVMQMVHDQEAYVLAVVELTADFHDRLEAAGIETVMPHHVDAKVGTGSPGSGLWSRTVLTDPDTTGGARSPCPQPPSTWTERPCA